MSAAKQVILAAGPPGSGKTTLCGRLAEGLTTSVASFEVGALLRREADRDTASGREIRAHLEQGRLVPAERVEPLVERELDDTLATLVFVDGYPRNRQQAGHLLEMEERKIFASLALVLLHLTEESARKRIAGRRTCGGCGRACNIHFDPPRREGACDACGGELEQRADDNPRVVAKRLAFFTRKTLPATEILQALRPERVLNLSGEGELDAVAERARRGLGEMVPNLE